MSENKKIEGWPLTDPYPFRDSEKPPSTEEVPDCDFVASDKKYAESAKVEEIGDYSYIMKRPWEYINELHQKVQNLKEHIQWLENVGGERLNMACGIDILCRGLAKKKAEEKAALAAGEKQKV